MPIRGGRAGRPGMLGRPRRADQSARPAAQPAGGARVARPATPAAPGPGHVSGTWRRPVSRTPFILLVLALLGCGLVCLLVINTTLAAASFQISNLHRDNTQAPQRAHELHHQVPTAQPPNSILQRALRL